MYKCSWFGLLHVVSCFAEDTTGLNRRREPVPVEAKGAAVVGSFGLIFLVVEISVFVRLDTNLYRIHIVRGYTNIKQWLKRHGKSQQFQAIPGNG